MADETGKKAPEAKKGGGFKFIILMIGIGALVPIGLPSILICLGMIPTLIAIITDDDPRGYGGATVGLLNAAGVTPFMIDLWQNGQTMTAAMNILKDPTSWIVMFGAAALGHLILYAVPAAIALLTITKMEHRLRKLEDGLTKLHDIWGAEVATQKPIDDLRANDEA